ncbi:MAG: hypothetical protein AAGF97_20565, partial [Planctomycetota bacterium]
MLSLDQLASDPVVHRYGDLFNPPALTNFRGCVGAAVDVTGITSVSFPPFAAGETSTAALRINHRHAQSLGASVRFQWFPDRIERTMSLDDWEFSSTTLVPMEFNAVVIRVTVTNRAASSRTTDLGWTFQGRITRCASNWSAAVPPSESDNRSTPEPTLGRIVFTAAHSDAVCIQGVFPIPDRVTAAVATSQVTLAAGESKVFTLFWVVEEDETKARETYDTLVRQRE